MRISLLDAVTVYPKAAAAGALGVGGVVGGAVGVAGGRAWQKAKDWERVKTVLAENSSLHKEIEALKQGNREESQTRQARAVLRVAILRQLAWQDNVLHDKEKLYVYDYILCCPDIDAETKIELMRDLVISPPKLTSFWSSIRKTYKGKIFASKDEQHGFIKILRELAAIDGYEHPDELKYIDTIVSQCGEPFAP